MAFLGLFHFLSSYAGLDCTICWSAICFLIYNKIIDCITKPLSIKTIWNRELSDLNLSVNWERVWSNLSLTSKNLKHLKSFQISGQCPDFNTRFNNFRIASFNLELLCFSISLDIPSKPQDFKIFKDLILPISSL